MLRLPLLTFSSAALLIFLLYTFTSPASAATPTSFCKCTCFKKSYIIALDPPTSKKPSSDSASSDDLPRSITTLSPRHPEAVVEADAEGRAEGEGEGDGEEGGDPQKEIPEYKAKTCTDCNRQFCLALDLPICKGATDEDVTTSCFQRDSGKDEAVVFIFIIATVSLLGWALIRPWVRRWMASAKERRSYIPIANEGDQP